VGARFPAGSPACAQTVVSLFSFVNIIDIIDIPRDIRSPVQLVTSTCTCSTTVS